MTDPTEQEDPALDGRFRAYDDPVDGRYVLAVDVARWMRHLAEVGAGANALNAVFHVPLLTKLADQFDALAVADTEKVPRRLP